MEGGLGLLGAERRALGAVCGRMGVTMSIYYRITLKREGEEERELGTAPTEESVGAWFSGAFAQGLLPNPPLYTDEIRVYEHSEEELDWRDDEVRLPPVVAVL